MIGSSIPPLLALIGQQQLCPTPGGLSLVIGISIPPLLASHWSTAFLARPWPLIGERKRHRVRLAEAQRTGAAVGNRLGPPGCPLRRQPVAVPFAVGCGDLGRLRESGPPPPQRCCPHRGRASPSLQCLLRCLPGLRWSVGVGAVGEMWWQCKS